MHWVGEIIYFFVSYVKGVRREFRIRVTNPAFKTAFML